MNIREIAYKTLVDIVINDKFSNLSLREFKNDFNDKDQAFLSEIVYGTLRNYYYCQAAWQRFSNKKTDKKVEVLLTMATYELLFMKSQKYAVINESCEIIKNYKKGFAVSFCNAILRKVNENEFICDDKATLFSLPSWIYKMWCSQYSTEIADKIAISLLDRSKTYIRANTLLTTKEELLKDSNFIDLDNDALLYNGNIIRTDYFRNNLVLIQDYHSQKISEYAQISENERVLDLCAAPGTKTIHTASLMHNTGEIIAVDLYKSRVEIMKEGLKKAGVKNTICCVYDAIKINEILEEESFDTVLVDALCSGLGVLRHKADIKLRIKPENIDEIVKTQAEILNTAYKMIRNGGKLVYSTCTLNTKENERQISSFLKKHLNMTLEFEKTMFPFEDEADGFYVAILRKKV